MAHEEKLEQKVSSKKRESLEERLQRIEAEAAKRMKAAVQEKTTPPMAIVEDVKVISPPEKVEEAKKKSAPPTVKKKKNVEIAEEKTKEEKPRPPRKKAVPKKREPKAVKAETEILAAEKNELEKVETKRVVNKRATTKKVEKTPGVDNEVKAEAKEAPVKKRKSTRSSIRNKTISTSTINEKEAIAVKTDDIAPQKVAAKKTEVKPVPKEKATTAKAKTTKSRASSRRKSTTPTQETSTQSTDDSASKKERANSSGEKKTTTRTQKTKNTPVKKTTAQTNGQSTVKAEPAGTKRTTAKRAPRKNSSTTKAKSTGVAKKTTSPKKTSPARGNSNGKGKQKGTNINPLPAQPDTAKDLFINSTPTQVEIALLENKKLVELHHQKTNNNFTVGDIFLGRIKRLMPGLNAAFVDIGHKKDAFLHYTDLGPKLRSLLNFTDGAIKNNLGSHTLDNFTLAPEIIKTGKIDQVLNKRDSVLVQVLKEPIGTKGPRLSCEITIPGRFLVLTPFVDVIAVSKKIGNSEERKRLKMLIESIKPKNFGVIVRTAAEGKKVQDLHEELKMMMDKWESIYSQLHDSQPPMKLLSELDKASSILRDVLNDSFNNIIVNDKELYNNIKTFMGSFAPDQVNIVNLHRSRKPIFDEYGITKQIKSSFGKTATMSSGAYLVIEHTEAMHVIDVNSGHKMSSSDQEEAVLSVNLESAEEIARQMRLRDIGGIIIIDYIDMRNKDNKMKLVSAMRQFMKKDRAQHTILPLSKFGLMQITRQRVRPEVKINTAEVCPSCNGTGKINPSILLVDAMERDLKFILQSHPKSKLVLHVHPYVDAYLKKGIPSLQMKWYMKFYKWIKIRPNADYSMTSYKFYDGNDDEIRLK